MNTSNTNDYSVFKDALGKRIQLENCSKPNAGGTSSEFRIDAHDYR